MQGIVSMLDEVHSALVEEISDELAHELDVSGLYETAFPHFSYHVAEKYDAENGEEALRRVARGTSPFRVRTSGLGIFTGVKPILYVPVVRSPELARIHQEIWRHVVPAVPAPVTNYYHPEMWVPHVTLAQGGIDQDKLAEIVRRLSARNFHWELTVNNLSIIYDDGTKQGVRCRFQLGERGANAC